MKWEDALRESRKCSEAIPACLEVTSYRRPPPDAEAVVMCKIKVREGRSDDLCNSDCPLK